MSQIAVIGLGRFGFHVARSLYHAGEEVLAIDRDELQVRRIKDHCTRAVVLDGRDKERLEALGLATFDVAVVSLGEQVEASALVTLHLRELGVRRIYTKAGSEDHGKLLSLIGAHEVLFPEQESAERLARRLHQPNLLDFIPLGEDHSIEEIATPSAYAGQSLEELDLPGKHRVQVLGVRDALSGRIVLNPGAGWRLKPSEALLVLGPNHELARIMDD
jgi:trk system potassium uptake protein